MRLIKTDTLELEEFFEPEIPSHAILSHRWTKHETTFKDYKKGRKTDSLGHRKTVDFCAVARRRGHAYAWIDTVCIDKQSSSELSEAINSMYRWYHLAAECLVHLADVACTGGPLLSGKLKNEIYLRLRLSDWFNRGWTLQELIAPRNVLFFTRDWKLFGCKLAADLTIKSSCADDQACVDLANELSKITGIPQELLTFQWPLEEYTIAARAKWLADRKLTRVEDQAYCALGLFGINMSLLYGEGERAWTRLQEEIIRTTHDESVLAWPVNWVSRVQPLLSSSPHSFSTISPTISTVYGLRPLYTITNQGLRWDLEPGSALIGKVDLSGVTSFQPTSVDARVLMVPLACIYEDQPTCQEYLLLIELACGHYMRVPNRDTLKLPLPLADLIRRGEITVPCRLAHQLTIFVHLRSDHSKGCKFAYHQLLPFVDIPRWVDRQFRPAIDASIHSIRGRSTIQNYLKLPSLVVPPEELKSTRSGTRPTTSCETSVGHHALEGLPHVSGITRMVDCPHHDCDRKANYGFTRVDRMLEHMRQVHDSK